MDSTKEFIADYIMGLSENTDLNRAVLLAASRIIRNIPDDQNEIINEEYVYALNDIDMERCR